MNNSKQPPHENNEATEEIKSNATETPEGATTEAAAAESEQEKVIAAQAAEIADLKDKLLRAMAEVENMRRRAEREKQDAHTYAVTKFARDVLSVSDNLRRAIESIPAEARENTAVKNVLPGIEMTEAELMNILGKYNIRKIEAEGQKFDPNLHQAMYEIENTTVEPGTVLHVTQSGFTIADRLLRPAMVGVAKGGKKAAPQKVDEKA
ncbi:MAG: nucleotide exchange factor GrpE [Alphaproteobacteria bacterium]|nr:MAG: nucleotide exchange factor GrpE [Alphaproteobacteria bacterium]